MIYTTPSSTILDKITENTSSTIYDGSSIAEVLTAEGFPCRFVSHQSAPQVTTYHFNLCRLSHITNASKAARMLSARTRSNVQIVASAFGDVAFAIPKRARRSVQLKEVLCSGLFIDAPPLLAALGVTNEGDPLTFDIAKMPHVLIAGATGSGKSVCLNTIICSLLMRTTPADAQFIMIDPKKVELTTYNGLPQLIRPVITDTREAISILQAACKFMDERYSTMKGKCRNAAELGMPSVVIIIDELSDLMITSKYEAEDSIIRLAQLGRAAGIHLIIATQRPTVNVITGLIKSNIPCKIALQVSSIRDSLNVIDHKGAESLLGRGDALIKLPSQVDEIRFQTAYTSDKEIENIVNYCKFHAMEKVNKNV